jgi:antitoxin CptB
MTGMGRSSEGLDERRRRLLFRAWHRGIREMDLIMGRFADSHIAQLDADHLTQFEHLTELQDVDVLSWITGECPVPKEYDTPLFWQMRDFHWNLKSDA